jgi:hypothetical protein
MTLTAAQAGSLPGRTAVTSDGEHAGKVSDLFAGAAGDPEWVTLKSGVFGTRENFAPLSGAAVTPDGDLSLAVTLAQVRDAPGTDGDGSLTPGEISQLYAHYGVPPGPAAPAAQPGYSAPGQEPAAPAAQSVPVLQRYEVTEETRQVGKRRI